MPDQFGNPTPEELSNYFSQYYVDPSKYLENNADRQRKINTEPKTAAGRAGNVLGAKLGTAWVRWRQTSAARKQKIAEYVQAGMSEEEATAKAKAEIPWGTNDERKMAFMDNVADQEFARVDALIQDGGDPEMAMILARNQAAYRLSQAGFFKEAQGLRQLAWNDYRQLQTNRLGVEQAKANLQATRQSNTAEQADWDTVYKVNYNKEGQFDSISFLDVAKLDPEGQADARAKGYHTQVPKGMMVNMTTDDMGRRTVPSSATQETLVGSAGMLGSIRVMRAAADAGHIGLGNLGFAKAFAIEHGFGDVMNTLGIMKQDDVQVLSDAVAHRAKMRSDIQAIIKGIPSNYDAKIFEKTIPSMYQSSETLYRAQLNLLEDYTKEVILRTVAIHKGTKSEVGDEFVNTLPMELRTAIDIMGIDVNKVRPLSREEATSEEANDKFFEALDNKFYKQSQDIYNTGKALERSQRVERQSGPGVGSRQPPEERSQAPKSQTVVGPNGEEFKISIGSGSNPENP